MRRLDWLWDAPSNFDASSKFIVDREQPVVINGLKLGTTALYSLRELRLRYFCGVGLNSFPGFDIV